MKRGGNGSGLAVPLSAAFALLLAGGTQAQTAFKYPKAETTFVDDYHGTMVADPYRWLEDPDSSQTRRWIDAENAVTTPYLKGLPQRAEIEARLKQLWNYEKFGTPGKEGGHYFYSYNTGLQNQGVMYVTDDVSKPGKVLLDPNTLLKDGTAALAGSAVSDDGKYMAYGIAEAGSDWNVWKVREISTGKDLDDVLRWVKFSGASWTKDNKGFFYSRYDEPKKGQELTGSNYYPKVYYHHVGTPQAQDVLVYERPDQKEWGLGVGVSDDGHYAVMSLSQGTDHKNRLYVRDLTKAPIGTAETDGDKALSGIEWQIRKLQDALDAGGDKDALGKNIADLRKQRTELVAKNGNAQNGFVELLNDFDASYGFVDNIGGTIFLTTNLNAPRSKVISIDLANPAKGSWKEIIPQAAETLESTNILGGDHFFCTYLKDAHTQVKEFDATGKMVREVQFPGIGTAGGFGGKKADTETFYAFSSYTTVPSVFRYDVKTGQSTLWKQAKVDFDASRYEVEQKFYTSKDGTKVPMFLAHKKGLKLDGNNPTLLYGYGGFNIPMTPGFSPATVVWLEMGGVYVVANIRGGGEYGEDWHQAGTRTKKQNVFDDFIGAAEYLIAQKYTSKGKIACQGGSNGGLLIGAMITQRPDLWGATLPAVGVMDMLRFQKFTIGWAWKSDYGDSEAEPDIFKAIYAYSPYHAALRATGAKWPPTLITTGDHDDRVVPAHSFKFAAALQATQTGDQPVLIRIDVRAGHGAGKPTAKRIEEVADQWAFIAKHTGAKLPSSEGDLNK